MDEARLREIEKKFHLNDLEKQLIAALRLQEEARKTLIETAAREFEKRKLAEAEVERLKGEHGPMFTYTLPEGAVGIRVYDRTGKLLRPKEIERLQAVREAAERYYELAAPHVYNQLGMTPEDENLRRALDALKVDSPTSG